MAKAEDLLSLVAGVTDYEELLKLTDGIKDYEEFLSLVEYAIFKTTGVTNQNLINHATFEKMFTKLPKKDGQFLLDLAIDYEEFPPDNVKDYQKIIDQK